MSLLTERFYKRTGFSIQKSYLETGTFKGENLESVINADLFNFIYSIELDPVWYQFNKERFNNYTHCFFYNGDSSQILPQVLRVIDFSCLFFLDAHYSGPGTAMGNEESPLLSELHILAKEKLDSGTVIIIDDCRMLGKKGWTEGGGNYQAFESDWTKITFSDIRKILGSNWICLTNNLSYWSKGKEDQLIFLRASGPKKYLLKLENSILDKICRLMRGSTKKKKIGYFLLKYLYLFS